LIVEGIIDQFVLMHESVRKKCLQYKAELNRHNYVTPKSYLELLLVFRKLLDIKRTELNALRKRTATGLEKLLSATKEVEILSEELNRMQPMLLQTRQALKIFYLYLRTARRRNSP
jgi:dynein heavy chain